MTPTPAARPEDPADERQHDRLGQELQEDLAVRRADRLAQADLVEPLADRDQHHRQQADPADDERDPGQAAEHDLPAADDLRDLLALAQHVLRRCSRRGSPRRRGAPGAARRSSSALTSPSRSRSSVLIAIEGQRRVLSGVELAQRAQRDVQPLHLLDEVVAVDELVAELGRDADDAERAPAERRPSCPARPRCRTGGASAGGRARRRGRSDSSSCSLMKRPRTTLRSRTTA